MFPPNGQPAARSPMPAAPGAPPPAAMPQQAQAVATAFHNQVLQRLQTLSPPEKQTLIAGITPPVAMVLKKVLPELADIIDKVTRPAAPPAPGAPMPGAPAAPPQSGAPPFPRPTTGLSRY